jgi:hypothetical protein
LALTLRETFGGLGHEGPTVAESGRRAPPRTLGPVA